MPIADPNGVKIAYVIVTRHDGVMRITMNRPTRKNALTAANMLTGNAVEEVEVRTKWGVRCRAGGYSDCRSRNNYLLGNAPPAFDILFWNSDTTSLPAQLHSDYLDLIYTNPFRNAGGLSICGTSIDMRRVKIDTYVVAGVTDHITPWKSVYQTARILGDDTTFILSNAGHLQSLLNPPGNTKATFVTGMSSQPHADAFMETAEKHTGSWWVHWSEWLSKRSGEKVAAAAGLGNAEFRPGELAPGTYVVNG